MKYVAFLDILGFKDKLGKMTQSEAAKFIGDFSTTAFHQWKTENISKLNGGAILIIDTSTPIPINLSTVSIT